MVFASATSPAFGQTMQAFAAPMITVLPASLLRQKGTETGVMVGAEVGLRGHLADNVWLFGKVSGLATATDFTTRGVRATTRGAMPFEASTALQAAGASAGAEWHAAGPFYVGAGIGLKHVWSRTQVRVSSPIGGESQSVDGRALLGVAHVDLGVEFQVIDNLYLRGFVHGEYGRSLSHTAHGPKQFGGAGGGFSAELRF